MKNWTVIYFISDDDIGTFEEFCEYLMRYVRKTEPMRQFLLKAAKSSQKKVTRPEFEL